MMLLTKDELRVWEAMSHEERQAWLAGARWAMGFSDDDLDGLRDTLDKLEAEERDGE